MKLLLTLVTAALALASPMASAGKVKDNINLLGIPGNFEHSSAEIDCTGAAVNIDPYNRLGQHGALHYGTYIRTIPNLRRGIVYVTDNKLRIIWQDIPGLHARDWEEYLPNGSRNPPEPAPLNLWVPALPSSPNC